MRLVLAFKTRYLEEERIDRIAKIKAKKKEDNEVPWWKSGSYVILPNSKASLLWGAIFNPAIFIFFIVLTYKAAFMFIKFENTHTFEVAIDVI